MDSVIQRNYEFVGNCITSTSERIDAMTEKASEVTWRTFRKHVPEARQFFDSLGAILDSATNDDIERTPFMTFYKSFYDGKPCYFAEWSRIEYIWVAVGALIVPDDAPGNRE